MKLKQFFKQETDLSVAAVLTVLFMFFVPPDTEYLGGLGTLIASMASLISYRQIARELPEEKGRYFKLFTLSNLIFLVILLAEWWVIGR